MKTSQIKAALLLFIYFYKSKRAVEANSEVAWLLFRVAKAMQVSLALH
jgi:hypothetical protein